MSIEVWRKWPTLCRHHFQMHCLDRNLMYFDKFSLTFSLSCSLDGSTFRLSVTQATWDCLHTCWQPSTVLQPLMHRFWKLTLQLLARYTTWMQEVKDTEVSDLHLARLASRSKFSYKAVVFPLSLTTVSSISFNEIEISSVVFEKFPILCIISFIPHICVFAIFLSHSSSCTNPTFYCNVYT